MEEKEVRIFNNYLNLKLDVLFVMSLEKVTGLREMNKEKNISKRLNRVKYVNSIHSYFS